MTIKRSTVMMYRRSAYANSRSYLKSVVIIAIALAISNTMLAQQKMNIYAGEVRYHYTNSEAHGERRMIFKDSGGIVRSITKDTIGKAVTTSDIITTYDSIYMFDASGKPVVMASQDREQKRAMERDYIGQRKWIGRESILGYQCDIFEYQDARYWVWKEVPLKRVIGENEMIEIATFFDPAFTPMPGDFSSQKQHQ